MNETKNLKKLTAEEFRQPGSAYRAAPLWSWNCKMTRETIDYTLEAMKDMGMGGAHLHCRTGLDTPYLGEEFMELVRYSHEKSNELGLLTWLYDEDRWPSGFAGGLITKDHRHRTRFLLFSPEKIEGEDHSPNHISHCGQAQRSAERTFLGKYQVCLEKGYLASYQRIPEDQPCKDGCDEWFAYLEISGESPWFNNQAYANTLDKETVEAFLASTHEKYAEVLGESFGKTVPAIFTDEPEFPYKIPLNFATERREVAIPYTDDFEDTFQACYGHSILDHLPELFWELPDGAVSRFRYEYHDHVTERFAAAYADTVGAWCRKHGIAMTGHMMEEPTLQRQTAAMGEVMRSYRAFDIPGIDMLCDQRELSTAKQAESAAHQYGRIGVMSELYGVTDWDFDFRGHKLQGDWQTALGVTVRVPHLTWTTMAGEAKRDFPASIGYQSPWYKEYPLIENYFARLNKALRRGTPHVRLGVIHPIESYWLYWGPKNQTSGIREEMDENFDKLIKWLLFGTVDFDFISEALLPDLNKGTQDGRTLTVGCMHYDQILVPNCKTLRSTTLEILEKFQEAGGTLLFAGEIPSLEDAIPSERGQKLAEKCTRIPFGKMPLLKALSPIRDVEILEADGTASQNLIYQMREEGENRWLFLSHVYRTYEKNHQTANEDLSFAEQIQLTLIGIWTPTQYDAMTGEIRPIPVSYTGDGKTVIQDTLYDQDSRLFFLEAGAKPLAHTFPSSKPVGSSRLLPISPVNPVIFHEPNVCILDLAEYRFDEEPWMEEDEILRIDNLFRRKLGYPLRTQALAQPWTTPHNSSYEHMLSLRFSIDSEIELKHALLALENDEKTTILLDGKEIKNEKTGWYTDRSIQTVALPLLTKGSHTLEFHIPYHARENIEPFYLLGDFTVALSGRHLTLLPPKKELAFFDITRQGYPFYGGTFTYRIPFVSTGGEVFLSASLFRSPVLRASVDGISKGLLAFSPYEISLGELTSGEHLLELTVFGNRINTFGTLHNCNFSDNWCGPDNWRTTGEEWSYEYQINPFGLLKAPILRIKDR